MKLLYKAHAKTYLFYETVMKNRNTYLVPQQAIFAGLIYTAFMIRTRN